MSAVASSGSLTIGGDREVHRLGFGAMRIVGPGVWGPPQDRDAMLEVLRRVISLGINLIDTADSYGPHFSEQLIHDALYPYPGGLLIATKGGLERSGPGQWSRNGRPEHLRGACERSLRDLRVERIDLYQLHAPDPDVPYEESVGALAEMQGDGLIHHIGVCNVNLEQLAEARSIVEVVSVQNRFNLTDRSSQAMVELCERDGLGFFPWFPLAAGELAKPGGLVAEIAENHDATPGQVALAWLLQRSPVMLPIPGTSSIEHLEENVAAAELELDGEELARLEDAA